MEIRISFSKLQEYVFRADIFDDQGKLLSQVYRNDSRFDLSNYVQYLLDTKATGIEIEETKE